ncbi:MAG: flagellar hook capping FlgD N-terminal domain-containing protein [Pseudomonadota bacterium]
MSIAGIGTSYGGASSVDSKTSSNGNVENLGMNQFLTLLVAQLEHQDPLNPMNSADFTAQLAQFASVEQLYGMNARLKNIQETLGSQGKQQDLVGLIGKTVKADDNTILVENGKVLSGSYSLKDAANAIVRVYNRAGQEVRTLYNYQSSMGEHRVEWDGRNNAGNRVADGTYTFEVVAVDEKGRNVAADTYVSGEVTGVTYEYGQPYLMIGNRLIRPDDTIVEISKTGTAAN